MKKKSIISILLSLCIVAVLLIQVDISIIFFTLKDLPRHLILVSFVLYALSYLFKAMRFSLLVKEPIGLWNLFNIVCLHNLFINFMPFRTGEISYLYLLKKRSRNDSYLAGVPSLLIARIFDFISITVLFFISLSGVKSLPEELQFLVWSLLTLIVFALVCISLLIVKKEAFLHLAVRVLSRLRIDRVCKVKEIQSKGLEIIHEFKQLSIVRLVTYIFIVSIGSWTAIYLSNYYIIQAIGIYLTLWQTFFLLTFFVLISFFPIQGWAGFGTLEGVWTLTIIFFGVSKETAIVTGFQLHLIGLAFTLLLGLWAFIMINSPINRNHKSLLGGDTIE